MQAVQYDCSMLAAVLVCWEESFCVWRVLSRRTVSKCGVRGRTICTLGFLCLRAARDERTISFCCASVHWREQEANNFVLREFKVKHTD